MFPILLARVCRIPLRAIPFGIAGLTGSRSRHFPSHFCMGPHSTRAHSVHQARTPAGSYDDAIMISVGVLHDSRSISRILSPTDIEETGRGPSRSAWSSPRCCMSRKTYRFVRDTAFCGIADAAFRPRRESSP